VQIVASGGPTFVPNGNYAASGSYSDGGTITLTATVGTPFAAWGAPNIMGYKNFYNETTGVIASHGLDYSNGAGSLTYVSGGPPRVIACAAAPFGNGAVVGHDPAIYGVDTGSLLGHGGYVFNLPSLQTEFLSSATHIFPSTCNYSNLSGGGNGGPSGAQVKTGWWKDAVSTYTQDFQATYDAYDSRAPYYVSNDVPGPDATGQAIQTAVFSSVGANSGTLSAPFTGPSGTYNELHFSNAAFVYNAVCTKGSTTISWSGGVTNGPAAAGTALLPFQPTAVPSFGILSGTGTNSTGGFTQYYTDVHLNLTTWAQINTAAGGSTGNKLMTTFMNPSYGMVQYNGNDQALTKAGGLNGYKLTNYPGYIQFSSTGADFGVNAQQFNYAYNSHFVAGEFLVQYGPNSAVQAWLGDGATLATCTKMWRLLVTGVTSSTLTLWVPPGLNSNAGFAGRYLYVSDPNFTLSNPGHW